MKKKNIIILNLTAAKTNRSRLADYWLWNSFWIHKRE